MASQQDYTVGAIGISSIANVMAQQAQTEAYKNKLNAMTQAAITNAGNKVTSFELASAKNVEAINNINQVMGDKLSERALTAMKEASLLKAAGAETGTSGGTTDDAINEAYLNEHFDKANIISSAKQQRGSILATMEMQESDTRMSIDSMLTGGVEFSGSTGAALAQGALQGVNTGLTYASLLSKYNSNTKES